MEQPQIQIKAKDEDLKGNYSNLMFVAHTKEEFILDFLLNAPPSISLISRIIMSPSHAKRMLKALQENIGKYEGQFNKIEETKAPDMPQGGIGFNVEKNY
ncbi:MAG: DUF3467 domain-containing protein [Candidatus Pacebacteria bacterium]|nr:DUF3467 domain-containing protein [Candidatus Paceibacterota bacterium]